MFNVIRFSGADGSLRMFDLRHLEHSTIMFEEPSHAPLLRLECNKQDYNYVATFVQDSAEVYFIYLSYFSYKL